MSPIFTETGLFESAADRLRISVGSRLTPGGFGGIRRILETHGAQICPTELGPKPGLGTEKSLRCLLPESILS